MTTYYTETDEANLGSLTVSGGAASVVFAPSRPIDIQRVIFINTVAQTVANVTATISVRDVDDANSTTIGTATLAFAGSATDDVLSIELVKPKTTAVTGVDGSVIYRGYNPGGPVKVNPGQEFVVTSGGGATAGAYQVYVEYFVLGFSGDRIAKVKKLAFTPA